MRTLLACILIFSVIFNNMIKVMATINDVNDYYIVNLDTIVVTGTRISNNTYYTNDNIHLLSRLIYSEAGGETFVGKLAVANVVMNIAKYNDWTIRRTIFDNGRFDGIYTKHFNMKPDNESIEAAKLALQNFKILPESIMFYHNPDIATDKEWVAYIEQFKYKRIGNHVFCYHPNYYTEYDDNEIIFLYNIFRYNYVY